MARSRPTVISRLPDALSLYNQPVSSGALPVAALGGRLWPASSSDRHAATRNPADPRRYAPAVRHHQRRALDHRRPQEQTPPALPVDFVDALLLPACHTGRLQGLGRNGTRAILLGQNQPRQNRRGRRPQHLSRQQHRLTSQSFPASDGSQKPSKYARARPHPPHRHRVR